LDIIGKNIGNYRIISFIKEGGIASVWQAEHTTLFSKVAVKILKKEFAIVDKHKERFLIEAKVVSRLKHENIVDVIDIAEFEGCPVIIMELLQGRDLQEFIAFSGKIYREIIDSIFTQVLFGIEAAHSKNICHRDIKPSNIFLTNDKKVKILDFGIAKIVDDSADFTKTGTQVGTPAFMSPEQIRGEKDIDTRSDIYSLGVTLFTLINGTHPYDDSESTFSLSNKIVFEKLQPLDYLQEYNAVIAKATEKDKNKRYQNTAEFFAAFSNAYNKSINNNNNPSKDNASKKTAGKKNVLFIAGGIFLAICLFVFFKPHFSDSKVELVQPIERKIRKEIQQKTDIKIGDLSLENTNNDEFNSMLNKLFSNKDIAFIKCKDFQDLTNKIYTKEIDLALLQTLEIPESQTVFIISDKTFLFENNTENYFLCIPNGENNKKSFSDFFKPHYSS
jgi:serine/threonine protein kinase